MGAALGGLVTGGATTLEVDGASVLHGRWNKRGALVRLAGKLKLRDATGTPTGTYAIKVSARR